MAEKINHIMDTTGLFCPEPVMLLHSKVNDAGSGDIIKIIATDPSTLRDIPKFCGFLGHTLLKSEEVDNQFVFLIEIKSNQAKA